MAPLGAHWEILWHGQAGLLAENGDMAWGSGAKASTTEQDSSERHPHELPTNFLTRVTTKSLGGNRSYPLDPSMAWSYQRAQRVESHLWLSWNRAFQDCCWPDQAWPISGSSTGLLWGCYSWWTSTHIPHFGSNGCLDSNKILGWVLGSGLKQRPVAFQDVPVSLDQNRLWMLPGRPTSYPRIDQDQLVQTILGAESQSL